MDARKVHEDILRHLWSGLYFDVRSLAALDGSTLRIIEPGVLNRDSGPDFRDARIDIGGVVFRGDIEFHRSRADWNAHAHDGDPRYNSVILHVVLYDTRGLAPTISASGRSIPVVVLERFLSSPLEKIIEHTYRDEHLSRSAPLRCFHQNDSFDAERLRSWIRKLFDERMREKEARILARLIQIVDERRRGVREPEKHYGGSHGTDERDQIPVSEQSLGEDDLKCPGAWDQLLYGAVMDGLGYAKNRGAFRTLASRVSLDRLKSIFPFRKITVEEIQAILFAVSAVMPPLHTVSDHQSKVQIHTLHTMWKSICAGHAGFPVFPGELMQATDWVFTPSHPSNFPTIRIAAAGVLASKIINEGMMEHLRVIVAGQGSSDPEKLEQLLSLLDIPEDPYWSFHYSFSAGSMRSHALLGASRKCDIIINALLPLCRVYGRLFNDTLLAEGSARVADIVAPLESNAVLRTMERQLIKGRFRVSSAFQQQGVIQLYRRYCIAARCSVCEIGKTLFG